MTNFEEVKNDIIKAIDKLEYTDNEKKLIQGMFIIGLCRVFENEEIYKENMIILDQNTKRKGKGLGLSFNSANNR